MVPSTPTAIAIRSGKRAAVKTAAAMYTGSKSPPCRLPAKLK